MTPTATTADPLAFAELLWPDVRFYRQQRDIIVSVAENDETFVPAGNMLGKDFVAAFIALWFFLTRTPCRVVTTSVDGTQLEGVLWGEIRRFLRNAKHPLEFDRGGPLLVNHLHIRQAPFRDRKICGLSYLLGRVAAKGEGMLGHHIADTGDGIPRTLFIADEASGVEDVSYERADTWAKRKLVIGNPYPCENFFKKGVKAGDLPRPNGSPGYYRRVIRVRGEDSPNVRLALAQQQVGQVPDGRVILPGVLPWSDYEKRRATWDEVRQCIGLDAEFYEGAELLLFPPDWLNRANEVDRELRSSGRRRVAKSIGVDPGEGEANTVWCAGDERGVIEMESRRTPNTAVIPGDTMAFARKHGVPADRVLFDRGGGGKQAADRLRMLGFDVRTVAFGSAPESDPRKPGQVEGYARRVDVQEDRYAYKNRRAQMYHEASLLLDPVGPGIDGFGGKDRGFGLPSGGVYDELRRQLAVMPNLKDDEGRCWLPPKDRRDDRDARRTLSEIVGHSPDEADAFVLMVHGLLHRTYRAKAGAF